MNRGRQEVENDSWIEVEVVAAWRDECRAGATWSRVVTTLIAGKRERTGLLSFGVN